MLTSALIVVSLASTSYAQYCYGYGCDNDRGWRSGYTAAVIICIIAALIFALLACSVNRRRRYARQQHPTVKPPMFGTAPPGYALPFWSNNRAPAPPYETSAGADVNAAYGHEGGNGGVGGMQYPPPAGAAAAPSDPPPPSYGKAVNGADNEYSSPNPNSSMNHAGGSYAPPIGPPPQAHTAGETGHFVGGFRQQ